MEILDRHRVQHATLTQAPVRVDGCLRTATAVIDASLRKQPSLTSVLATETGAYFCAQGRRIASVVPGLSQHEPDPPNVTAAQPEGDPSWLPTNQRLRLRVSNTDQTRQHTPSALRHAVRVPAVLMQPRERASGVSRGALVLSKHVPAPAAPAHLNSFCIQGPPRMWRWNHHGSWTDYSSATTTAEEGVVVTPRSVLHMYVDASTGFVAPGPSCGNLPKNAAQSSDSTREHKAANGVSDHHASQLDRRCPTTT
ncbi:hypothetical protein Micbo1qcDRAFT_225726 [Microdochium bolleyi]|uniref:Uncharacterized protein n=1 Tax=Microdochium bolleyi TaxID=196109 RepID=A0A136J0Y4_9PEZI|nr:hypothetical protein Micbo1qcDRAFT_225726 [Microdochium bolleyi]